MERMKTHPDAIIIDALGGSAAVAEAGSWALPRVSNWRQRGIPDDFATRLQIARLAVTQGVDLPGDRFPRVEDAA